MVFCCPNRPLVFFVCFSKQKEKNQKKKKKKKKKQTNKQTNKNKNTVFVYVGTCVPLMAIETKFLNFVCLIA